MDRKVAKLVLSISLVSILFACSSSTVGTNKESTSNVHFYKDIFTFEYGSNVDLSELDIVYGYYDQIELPTIVTSKIGESIYEVIADDQPYDLKVIIVDSVMPVISGVSDKTITVGSSVDLKEGITVSDLVDGTLEPVIEGSVDTSKAGTYPIQVSATDKNGNKATSSFNVIVEEKKTGVVNPSVPNTSGSDTSINKPSSGSNSSSSHSGSNNGSSTKPNTGSNGSNNPTNDPTTDYTVTLKNIEVWDDGAHFVDVYYRGGIYEVLMTNWTIRSYSAGDKYDNPITWNDLTKDDLNRIFDKIATLAD